ncbi:hypothetical protein PM082_008280 [Marasmius tenuissimus]|nr:hypothetical protein PM082_008280 [Marasmius tenuissimus]
MSRNPFIPDPGSPPFPSLYNPREELFGIGRFEPGTEHQGIYLKQASDVFTFTFYWILIFYLPAFVFCGFFAFLNLTFPPTRKRKQSQRRKSPNKPNTDTWGGHLSIPLTPLTPSNRPNNPNDNDYGHNYQTLRSDVGVPLLRPPSPAFVPQSSPPPPRPKPRKSKERRSRVTFALIVLVLFLVAGLLGAIVSAAIIGFVLHGVYKAGGFNMSTWVPFAWAALHTCIGMLNLWPSVIAWI